MFDVCVIGAGGVVGCAIAREAALRGLSVAAVEKHTGFCKETSGLNSRVIHSGFHETAGSLKAELSSQGSALIIIRTSYIVHVDLPGYPLDLHFNPATENKGVL